MRKRGQAEPGLFAGTSTVKIILAVIVIFVLVGILIKFFGLGASFFGGRSVSCGNAADFDAVKSLIRNIEGGKGSGELFFANNDCFLVSFDPLYKNQKVISASPQVRGSPVVCGCQIENNECKVYKDCYRFSVLKGVAGEQFSSKDFGPNIFLRFQRDGEYVRITVIGDKAQPKMTYAFKEQYRELDPQGIVRKLDLTLQENVGKEVFPVVKTMSAPAFVPAEIPSTGAFPFFFSVMIARVPENKDITLTAFVQQAQAVDPVLVDNAELTLRIPVIYWSSVKNMEKYHLRLFMKKNNQWIGQELVCPPQEKILECTAKIKGFASDFAVSVIQNE